VVQAVEGGVDMVQIREKDLPGGRLLALAQSLKDAVQGRALLIVNDRADISQVVGASGVQLGEDGLTVSSVRRILGMEYLIGRSVHTALAAGIAERQGADFAVAGTMYTTRSHPGSVPAGPGLIENIVRDCSLPIIGIGGITPYNLAPVIRAGASGVAVISNVLGAQDPRRAAEELKQALQEAASTTGTLGPSEQPTGGNGSA